MIIGKAIKTKSAPTEVSAPKNANPNCRYTNLYYFHKRTQKREYAFLPKAKMRTLNESIRFV